MRRLLAAMTLTVLFTLSGASVAGAAQPEMQCDPGTMSCPTGCDLDQSCWPQTGCTYDQTCPPPDDGPITIKNPSRGEPHM